MNLKRLQAFAAVFDSQSVTDAARRLNTTQPAVSRLIRDLETELGLVLFAREKRRMIPTAEGRAFYDEARVALAAVDQIIDVARDQRTMKGARLRIVAPMLTAFGRLPAAIRAFRAAHPEVRVSIEIKDLRDVADWVANGPFDIGFTALPFADDRVQCEILAQVRQMLVVPASHPLAARKKVKLADIAREHLILPSGDPPRATILAAFAQSGLEVTSMIDTSSAFSVCQLVAQELGLGLVDPYTFETARHMAIAARPTEPEIAYPFGLFYPRHRAKSAVVQSFAAMVRKALTDSGNDRDDRSAS